MPTHAESPTAARHWVVVFAVTLSIITYIDRVCISQFAPYIQRDLGFTKEEMGWVFAAFALAYSLFEIPAGWMGDRSGPRGVLMKVVVMWSAFTAATGFVWNLVSMVICRFFFGMGEAGCFPNLTKAFTIWLPRSERVRAQGIMWLSARWGGAFTPLLVVWVLGLVHSWRVAFVIFGAIGVVWAVWFYRWFRDDPREHPSVNAAELALITGTGEPSSTHQSVPWGKLLASRSVWLLWLQYFCMSYGWYFYITWLPTYLREARGVDLATGAFLAGFPLFFGGLGSFLTGITAAPLARALQSTAKARRLFSFTGLLSAAVMLVISTRIESPMLAMVSIGFASFANDMAMPAGWGACMDVGGRFAGTLSGSMNMMGNFGGAVAPVAVAQILEHSGNNWVLTFWVAAGVYLAGAIAWLFIDPVTPIGNEDSARS